MKTCPYRFSYPADSNPVSEYMPDAWVVPYACMTITMCIGIAVLLETPPPLFELKLMYSYVIELADSESDLVFFQ